MVNLTSKETKIIDKYSKKLSIPKTELTNEFVSLLVEEQKLSPNVDLDTLRKTALIIFREKHAARGRSTATDQEGFFIGDTGPYDINRGLRSKAKALIDENFNDAVLEGLVDRKTGEILDNRAELWGRTNPGFKEPLKTVWRRRVYGCFLSSTDYEFGILNLNGARARNTMLEYFTPCNFPAIDKGMDAGYLTLNQSKYTEFTESDKKINVYETIKNALKDYKAEWNELDKAYESTKEAWDGVTLLEGYVKQGINITDRSTILTIADPKNEESLEFESVTCFIPRMWEINFGEFSTILALGKLRKRKTRSYGQSLLGSDNEDLGYTMSVYGIYPVRVRTPSEVQAVKSEDLKCTWHKKGKK